MNENFKSIIEKAWDDRSILHTTEVKEAINAINSCGWHFRPDLFSLQDTPVIQ